MQFNYPDLPITEKREQILQLLKTNQVVIIAGETGSGKTTQLPKFCLELGRGIKGIIGHTQPRRIAARSVARRLASELNTELGNLVGYQVRFNEKLSENTKVKIMTDGILLNEIHYDRLLKKYDTIIIDEAHERSLNNDFLLGYIKQILPKRKDLKLIITSATIDLERFSKYFDNAPIVEVSGRTYPVEIIYRPVEEHKSQDLMLCLVDAVKELQSYPRGDILVFLSGEREIKDATAILEKQNLPFTEILPLFARLSNQDQNKIFTPTNALNRIILATNIAETSLTIPNIKYVIDTGFARISRYSPLSKVQRLEVEPISKASANQRAGRSGRTSDGICIRLFSKEDFENRKDFTDPEILRTSLATVILKLALLGVSEVSKFPFIQAPDKRQINAGIQLLEQLQAFHYKNGVRCLSAIGRTLAQLPLDPKFAAMAIFAGSNASLKEILVIISALSIPEVREIPEDHKQAAQTKHSRFLDPQSDFMALINLWNYIQEKQTELSKNQFRKLCEKDFLNYNRINEWQDLHQQLLTEVTRLKLFVNQEKASYQAIHSAILKGSLIEIGNKDLETNQYQGSYNSKFYIFPTSNLFKKPPKWLVAGQIVATSKLWARMVAKIEPEWIEPLAMHLVKRSHSEPFWSQTKGSVLAYEKVTLFGLTIVAKRLVNFGKIDAKLSREIFIKNALVAGEINANYEFLKFNQQLVKDLEILEHKARRQDILVDEDEMFAFYDAIIPENVVSTVHFATWWQKTEKQNPKILHFKKEQLIRENALLVNADAFPDFWQYENFKLKLNYQFSIGEKIDGVTVLIPLHLLNQIKPEPFSWHILGLRLDLVTALIKALPKSIRKNFSPAINFAKAFLDRITDFNKSIVEALCLELFKMTGVKTTIEMWQFDELEEHLKLKFCIVDEKQNKLAVGDDLEKLKQQLKEKADQTLQKQNKQSKEEPSTSWTFKEIKKQVEQNQFGTKFTVYPALEDQKNAVMLKFCGTESEQTELMQSGLTRLILLNIASPVKFLQNQLSNKSKLALYFAPFGQVQELLNDCIWACANHLVKQNDLAWCEKDFINLKNKVANDLPELLLNTIAKVENILLMVFEINKKLKQSTNLQTVLNLADIKKQLGNLIFKNFVTNHGLAKLGDLLRYLKAILQRLENLFFKPEQDRIKMLSVQRVEEQYQSLQGKFAKPLVDEIRFMIEELRISLFAQQLGTKFPISEKRILSAIEKLKTVK